MFQRAVILSDSISAIKAITSPNIPINSSVTEIQTIIQTLQRQNKHIQLQWRPAHCGVS